MAVCKGSFEWFLLKALFLLKVKWKEEMPCWICSMCCLSDIQRLGDKECVRLPAPNPTAPKTSHRLYTAANYPGNLAMNQGLTPEHSVSGKKKEMQAHLKDSVTLYKLDFLIFSYIMFLLADFATLSKWNLQWGVQKVHSVLFKTDEWESGSVGLCWLLYKSW